MKKIFFVVVVFASCNIVIAQKRTNPTSKDTTPTAAKTMPPQAAKPKPGPKPFKEVITDKAISKKGLFNVHKVEDKYYFEIPNSLLGKEIMCVTRYSKVPGGAGVYGGEVANQQTLKFEKGPNDNIFIRTITLISTADSSQKISTAVSNSHLDAIAAAFDIKALGKDSTSSIIDVSDFFKGDNQIVSIDPNSKRRFSLSMLAGDRSYVQSINTYPINTEIKTVKTYISSPMPSAGASQSSAAGFPAARDAGAVTIELNTSMILLPEKPMARRTWDKRVGFFPDNFVVFSDDQQRVEDKTFAVRWRLEPKPEDVEKWKAGQLVEPIKPIIYYIDPATPPNWVPYLIAGINDWQKAFEKAGFKNAIMGKEWPKNDSTMSLEDARFSVIRYFASDIENAYGPNVHDPRTGEILESHIGWYHNVMKLVHDWYMVQTAAVNPRARKMVFDDDLMGQLIRFVSSHEVGHTIGLLHNMGSSSKTPVEKLRDKAWVEANGHTASIMDYARFNYVAQPEDNINEMGLFPRIGVYDEWAIKWGYGYIPGNTEEEQNINSDKLIVKALAENPRHWFGTYELGNSVDPRTQSEDLSDNVMIANEYGIKNLKRIIVNLPEWTKENGKGYDNLSEMYRQLVGQFNRYVNHVMRNVGGIYETFKSTSQQGDVFEFVPKATQKEAFNFINRNVLTTPTWLLDKNILNKIQNPTNSESVQNIQISALNNLLDPSRLNRMIICANRYGNTNVYLFNDLMDDTKKAVWSEAATGKAVDAYRRNLQKAHVERLINLLTFKPQAMVISGRTFATGPEIATTDIVSYTRGQLKALQAELTTASAATADRLTKFHYQDLVERIKLALNPR
ncbi:MAG TPA: zinc-dependent metalloprotease [Chitinophagaceae bacterium]|nr:zinc-dependent metalloprotease [Chitinophagaceae bacterium]HMZ45344.1 zinc-dependent metalloprotease [Chitinophagaceae bacterium]HNF28785.1 zinc-dependent metalloprotease [Chitinophagaceae bacterium]HNM34511.1 zinc-dependent metalloprotease [Chitinophagaceae bacterium]HNN30556.1 zinc-dependent metalloprotease [Chitinophagaceae bacterium]